MWTILRAWEWRIRRRVRAGAWAWRKRRCVAGSGAPDCATASDLYSGATLRRCRRGAEQDLCAIQQPPLFEWAHSCGNAVRAMRAVGDLVAGFPTRDGSLANAKLAGEAANGQIGVADVGSGFRRGRRVRVQLEFHDPRRSLTKAMPRCTPIPCCQSSGTKHPCGGGLGWGVSKNSSSIAPPPPHPPPSRGRENAERRLSRMPSARLRAKPRVSP